MTSREDVEEIGTVYALCSENDDSEAEAIVDGEIDGTGLLGDVVEAVHGLVSAHSHMIRRSDRGDYSGSDQLKRAWRKVYDALKAIEERE